MKSKSIQIIVVLSCIALAGLLVNQYFWISKESKIESNIVDLTYKNVQFEKLQFENKVTLALISVRDNLISLNNEASGLYLDPAKQITSNYFVVSFYDTLNPTILGTFLVQEFEQYGITEEFEYGIYDCFSDSIIYDQYVGLSDERCEMCKSQDPQYKWDHDGHYFGVYFPNKSEYDFEHRHEATYSLYASSIVILLTILILSYAIVIILRQKRLSEVKTDFINNMTHELKTPISTIALSSEVLLRKDISESPDRINRYAQIIHKENRRLEHQVEKVLQLAKLEKGQIELSLVEVHINEIIKNSVSGFKILVEDKGGQVLTSFETRNDVTFVDKVHITNTIYNLLDNATKYTNETPHIEVATRNKAGGIEISVSDNGSGLSDEQRKLIFDKFYRVPTGNVHNVKGFGLGLHYVKKIVSEHGGNVEVESQIGLGSTFRIWLPQKSMNS